MYLWMRWPQQNHPLAEGTVLVHRRQFRCRDTAHGYSRIKSHFSQNAVNVLFPQAWELGMSLDCLVDSHSIAIFWDGRLP
mmetsp:Transcript_21326/g.30488  ORF Transcript_21326/g.30488 Transcript_21326/m.30488 type:complete len:80 (-) Transcript_21326:124-363(-)